MLPLMGDYNLDGIVRMIEQLRISRKICTFLNLYTPGSNIFSTTQTDVPFTLFLHPRAGLVHDVAWYEIKHFVSIESGW